MIVRFFLLIALFAAPVAEAATKALPKTRGNAAIVYTREKITIDAQVPILPKTSERRATNPSYARSGDGSILGEAPPEKPEEPAAPSFETREYVFDTDIESNDSLRVDWFYTLSTIGEKRATMILIPKPAPIALPTARLYRPIDVLAVGEDGTILAILPQIVLANQQKIVKLDMPVKALVYLNGGTASRLHIAPKDKVHHRHFTADPLVLQ